MNSISLIIPSKEDSKQVHKLLSTISLQKLLPNEIILINTNISKFKYEDVYLKFFKSKKIYFRCYNHKNLNPGEARNVGVNYSKYDLIAFLDVNTKPNNDWLKNANNLINKKKTDIVLGTTKYLANNNKEKIIRASTFGSSSIITIPGSLLKRNVFQKCGYFLKNVRAGEDGDWIRRVKLHNIKTSKNNESLVYYGLIGSNFNNIVRKWFRNYSISNKLDHLKGQRDIYNIGLLIVLLFFIFNWNAMFADWDMERSTYIPHITKLSFLLLGIFYTCVRGIYLPVKKGENLKYIFPYNFIFITIFSCILDITKILAFFINSKKNY